MGALVKVTDEAIFGRASEKIDVGFDEAPRSPILVANSYDVGVNGVFGDVEGARHGA